VSPASLVIFDCDGVLVDSERISSRVFAGLLAELGLYFTLDEMVETFIGNSMARCEEIVTERLGFAPPDDLVERYHALTREALAREVQPVDGIIKLLDDLDVAHIPYCVASNGEHEKMRTSLGATGLLARFEGRRFSADDVTRPKPAPDLFLHTAEAMGVPAQGCRGKRRRCTLIVVRHAAWFVEVVRGYTRLYVADVLRGIRDGDKVSRTSLTHAQFHWALPRCVASR